MINESDVNEKLQSNTKKTELLFVKLMIKSLKVGGRCAVIVPTGVLFGSTNAHVQLRKELIEENQLDAVISMPSGIFKPYSGVSTAILIFTKGGNTRDVWFYNMESDGFELNDKRTFIDGKGDIPDIIKQYSNKNEDKKKTIKVNKSKIKENDYDLSINKYLVKEQVKIVYEKPDKILEKLVFTENEIQEMLKKIKI
jgi:type I restriction enzyme M protein